MENGKALDWKFYPIIIYPREFIDIVRVTSQPISPPPSEPIEPKQPYFNPNYKKENSFPFFQLIGFIISVILIASGIYIGILLILFFIAAPVELLFSLGSTSKRSYRKAYENECRRYPILLQNYEDNLDQYKKAKEKYEEEKKYAESGIGVLQYKEFLIDNTLKIQEKLLLNNEKNINKGSTEDYFYQYLKQYFGENISRNKKVQLNTFEYYPDYIYEEWKLIIDIEIDEPYVASTGEPIHYDYIDDERNFTLSKLGYVIIRFAEEQVALYPLNCCEVIKEVISEYRMFRIVDSSQFIIKKINYWTRDEAISMAEKNYRNSYLPKNLKHRDVNIDKIPYVINKKIMFEGIEIDDDDDDNYGLPF